MILILILILILGSGSGLRRDVQPCVAIGQGLRAAGRNARICTREHFAGFITHHGLGCRHMNNGAVELIGSRGGRAAIAGLDRPIGTLKVMATCCRRWAHYFWLAAAPHRRRGLI